VYLHHYTTTYTYLHVYTHSTGRPHSHHYTSIHTITWLCTHEIIVLRLFTKVYKFILVYNQIDSHSYCKMQFLYEIKTHCDLRRILNKCCNVLQPFWKDMFSRFYWLIKLFLLDISIFKMSVLYKLILRINNIVKRYVLIDFVSGRV